MEQYSKLLNQLGEYLEKDEYECIEKEEEDCCDNPEFRYENTDNIFYDEDDDDCEVNTKVCINCGTISRSEEIKVEQPQLNPRYNLTTEIGYGSHSSLRRLKRIHKWTKNEYKDVAANGNYSRIKQMGNELNLNHKIINYACFVFKKVYIEDEKSPRGNIRKSLYIYSLYVSSREYNFNFDIVDVLKKYNLSIVNYNNACLKYISEEEQIHLPKNLVKHYSEFKDNFTTNITIDDVILEYNLLFKLHQKTKLTKQIKKSSENTILMIAIFNLLNLDSNKKFYKIFKITPITINKFIRNNIE